MTESVIIYYFSGTGNSKNVAGWLYENATSIGAKCDLVSISNLEYPIEKPPEDTQVIIISPVHGFNYPPLVLKFITRFPKGKNRIVLMCTRAGLLIGKYNLPGVSGLTFYFSSLILTLKGHKISGMIPVDLPSNWISFHPGLNRPTVDVLYQKNKKKVQILAERIFAGKNVWRGLRDIIQDIIVIPISPAYYLVGRFFLAKTLYASRDCDDCDICLKACPAKGIIKIDNRMYWTFRCESCMKCIANCPKQAIETAHGFVIGYISLASAITGSLLLLFEKYVLSLESGLVKWIIESAILIFLLGVAYRIMHYLMRFKWIERMMVYTSLTKFKFWGKIRIRYYKHGNPVVK